MPNEKKKNNFLIALLTEPNTKKACEKANISTATAYKYLQDDDFIAELKKAREMVLKDTINYLQSNLAICSEVLMEIITDPQQNPQVRINAINTVFKTFNSLKDDNEVMERLEKIEKNQRIILSLK